MCLAPDDWLGFAPMRLDAPAIVTAAFNRRAIVQRLPFLVVLLLSTLGSLQAAESTAARDLNRETVPKWSASYRGWYYRSEHVLPPNRTFPATSNSTTRTALASINCPVNPTSGL